MRVDVEKLLRLHRRLIEPAIDAVVWSGSLLFVTALGYDLDRRYTFTLGLLKVIGIAVAAQVTIGWAVPLYRIRWKKASFEEIVALAATVTDVTVVVLLANVLFLQHAVPTRSLLAAGAVAFVGTAGVRASWRIAREYRVQGLRRAKRAIVLGAGEGGEQVIDALRSHYSPFLAVGLLDDDPGKRHTQIRHLRVSGGREQLAELAKKVKADTLIVAIPSADSRLVRELSDQASSVGLEIRVLPPTSELLPKPSVEVTDIRPISERDLLGRHTIETDVESIAGYLTGRRVLVTGAGGSIGSELCRQIHRFSPATLAMLDRDESGLQELQLSIEGRALLDQRNLIVCNIQDVPALRAVFGEQRPEVVFHAAALKHLPLLEMWPAEAVKTNILGTMNVLSAALEFGVERLVNISTDKAADPTSILGYTKRIAERLTATFATQSDRAFVSVRFGNVLGSRGSVLTSFRAQIEAGGPVTVTHPDVTRYFMTTQEAVQLVVQAGAIGDSGEVLVLDMGSPAKIADVARRLVGEAGRPIDIVFTGLRPGEKLHELRLGLSEADIRPKHPLISHVLTPRIDVEMLSTIELTASPSAIREMLENLCDSPAANADVWLNAQAQTLDHSTSRAR
jgi:FlaA1/EpsC-like NDP-sugar epimerase